MSKKILKYNSNYKSVISYGSDKNFLVRLKCLIEIRMNEAGYNTLNNKFNVLIESIEDAEDYLFSDKNKKH